MAIPLYHIFGFLISYTYDKSGNITTISENGALKARYGYDLAGRLIREDNADSGKSVTYAYNAGGNITSKSEYAFTIGALTGSPTTKTYNYDSVWKDKLELYSGYMGSINYDGMGNPISGYKYVPNQSGFGYTSWSSLIPRPMCSDKNIIASCATS